MSNMVLMQGNEACVAGAIKAGMKFYAGYPISPASEIAEIASVELPKVGGKFIQMEDEIAGMAAVVGASLAGLKSMTATSGPGFSLKQEVIGYASMAEIPCVIVDVMRGGPSTGLPTSVSQGDVMQSMWGTHGDHPVIVITPISVGSIYKLTIEAFNYAEQYRVPVILLLDEVIAHMRESISLEDYEAEIVHRKKPDYCNKNGFKAYEVTKDMVPAMANIGEGFNFHVTGLSHDEYGYPSNSNEVAGDLITRLLCKIKNNRGSIVRYEDIKTKGCKNLIVSFGSVARVCKELVEGEKLEDTGLFIPYTICPFPDKELEKIIEDNNIENIFVPELNAGQLINEIDRISKGRCKVVGINKYCGEIFEPSEIVNAIRGEHR
ncbi:2-oxoacid:acceptor oxidoreductase subunit alpha [Clostridium tagluense]|uniref:2-oxoacid:acceptor oxidoreductase subunit alpha n=1 Tax=Clostridium tagluense TaxID=360422 RepID=UPI001CF4F385|nr:2-oxoacid:acceptor oxidoreductase subunit alpha [Clostridium tagluense]MCB2300344.1 2-oxoacid:acceptor oxidoreductase subunit alpha [Clostridium tagluense]